MSILSRIFGKAGSKPPVSSNPADDYPEEVQEAVRKWLQRIFTGEDLRPEFWKAVNSFKATNGHEPVVNDIIWGLLNERRSLFFTDGKLGLYRNETLSMCSLLEIEGKEKSKFLHLVELTTLDACGAQNAGWDAPGGGPLSLRGARIAPLCTSALAACGRELDMSIVDLEVEFVRQSEATLENFGKYRPKITGGKIWNKIKSDVAQAYEAYKPAKRRARKKQPSLNVNRS